MQLIVFGENVSSIAFVCYNQGPGDKTRASNVSTNSLVCTKKHIHSSVQKFETGSSDSIERHLKSRHDIYI